MVHITTYTGKHFDATKPDMSLVDIHDIAHALSLTCRGNGHVKTFFSVGQHCINCAMAAEDKLLDLIYEKFLGNKLTPEELSSVKEIDNALLYYDLRELLNEVSQGPAPKLHIELNYDFIPFEVIERTYLEIYHQYKLF